MSAQASDDAEFDQQGLSELEAIYQTVPVGLCVLDRNLRYIRINERLAEINGVAAADHLGRTVREIVPHIADAAEPILHKVIETGEPVLDVEISGETEAHPGKTRTWIENYIPIKSSNGEVLGINIVAVEITKRKQYEAQLEELRRTLEERIAARTEELQQSEHRLSLAIRASQAAVYDHRVPIAEGAFHSDRWAQILGYEPHELPAAEKFEEWLVDQVHPDDRKELEDAYGDFVEGSRPDYDVEIRLRHKEDRWIWVRGLSTAAARDETGRVTHIVGVMMDVTPQKDREAALGALNELLEKRTQQVRKLASALTLAEQEERRRVAQILHDDLNQQLYGIQLKLSLLSRQIEELKEPGIQESVLQIGRYVDDAIDTTRNLMVELSPPVLKGEGLFESLQWLASQMRDRFGLEVELSRDGALSVPTDKMRVLLFQTVRELLFNVVKHSEVNQACVGIHENASHLIVEVVDEGAGFDVESLKALSQRSGFGLYHVRERLSLFGGRLEIESTALAGTRAVITIPVESFLA